MTQPPHLSDQSDRSDRFDPSQDRIRQNLEAIRRRITAAAECSGRNPAAIRLIAVTKSVGLEEIRALLALGVADLGENRTENARDKIQALGPAARWHMIGSIQRRKARDVVDLFDCADSVDRIEVAEALDKRSAEKRKILPVLLEVNVSGEAAKHGFAPDELPPALEQMAQWTHLRVEGLMTMAPWVEDPESVRPVFARLRRLADQFGLPEVSMGMSNDFEVAVEEGSTQVRVGTALFF